MRHDFAIKLLPKQSALSRQPYEYYCVRCKWGFRVNHLNQSLVALDSGGNPLNGTENQRRAATFADGPCPAFVTSTLERSHSRSRDGDTAKQIPQMTRALVSLKRAAKSLLHRERSPKRSPALRFFDPTA
jgi:hypothetical protein